MSGDRNKKANREVRTAAAQERAKAEDIKVENERLKSDAYHVGVRKNNFKAYVSNKLWGNYFSAWANAIAEQVAKGEFGMWNGILYTKEVLEAEFHVKKNTAISYFASAQINVKFLKEEGLTNAEIDDYFQKTVEGKMFREDYSDVAGVEDNMAGGFVPAPDVSEDKTDPV